MSDYSFVKSSKLVLKGEKRKKKHKKDKSEKRNKLENKKTNEDSIAHGGWWLLTDFVSLTGSICIEVLPHRYLRAVDNGTFQVGDQHINEGPDQEEVFTCIRATDTQIALKSGYNKYLSYDSKNRLIGRSDAIGDKELFEPIFEESDGEIKLAILASNKNFLSYDEEDNTLYASRPKVTKNELIKIRSNIDPDEVRREQERNKIPEEERGDLAECEEKYMRKYQSIKSDDQLKITKKDGHKLIKAKTEGNLHETLLDRRSKVKSDKFCK